MRYWLMKTEPGVVGIDGEMFDRPHLSRARRVLARLP